jgi:hypothetical protein
MAPFLVVLGVEEEEVLGLQIIVYPYLAGHKGVLLIGLMVVEEVEVLVKFLVPVVLVEIMDLQELSLLVVQEEEGIIVGEHHLVLEVLGEILDLLETLGVVETVEVVAPVVPQETI